jgi:hypothetical protein
MLKRSNNKMGRCGRNPGATLLTPGPQPESPILKPSRIHGGSATVYIREIPDDIAEGFRTYCAEKDYKLRHAALSLMRWATTNDLNLAPLYKPTKGDGAINIRDVPIFTSRNFHAYCMKRGYLVRYAMAALMQWAYTEDLDLAGAIR